MDFKTLSAWLVYCVDTGRTRTSVEEAWKAFKETAIGVKGIYTDPTDPMLYCEKLLDESPVKVLTDYTLFYFPKDILEAFARYGNIGLNIINHFKKQ